MRRTVLAFLLLPALPSLGAQEKLRVPAPVDAHGYTYQLRVAHSGPTLKEAGADSTGGGGGFGMVFGESPLKFRLRMDGDTWAGEPQSGAIQTIGLTSEAFYEFETGEAWAPFVSGGPAFQHWILGSGPAHGMARDTTNKLAFRAEAGVFIRRRFGISLGVLTGSLEPGRRATVTYLGFTFR